MEEPKHSSEPEYQARKAECCKTQLEEPPYTIFSPLQRRLISYACSVSAIFSTISSFIYFPAVTALASSLHVSINAINLTITSYQIVSGIAPAIFGDMADQTGRRPVMIVTFTIYVAANIGLALQSSYAALVVLRCLQSAGGSSTIAFAYGIIADISTPANRGSYVGVLMGFTNAAPSFGPELGGILSQELSWRWIFWILTITSGTHFLLLLAFLPETSRKLVGNGSIQPPLLNKSLYQILTKSRRAIKPNEKAARSQCRIPNPLSCLVALKTPENVVVIVVGGIQYTVYGCLAASLSAQMIQTYDLNYLNAGLVYLPAGVGGFMAALATGKLLDFHYRATEKALPHGTTQDSDFPIEKARLKSAFPMLVVSSIATAGYGWTLKRKTSIAAPLVMQFLSGASQVMLFVTCGTLLTDYNPERSATAQASYNLVRCALSAGGVAVLNAMIEGVGNGWCFTIFAAFGLLCVPLLVVLKHQGPSWRKRVAAKN